MGKSDLQTIFGREGVELLVEITVSKLRARIGRPNEIADTHVKGAEWWLANQIGRSKPEELAVARQFDSIVRQRKDFLAVLHDAACERCGLPPDVDIEDLVKDDE
jgi:hypothetical protein